MVRQLERGYVPTGSAVLPRVVEALNEEGRSAGNATASEPRPMEPGDYVDRNPRSGEQSLDTRDAVAGKGKRKRRKRTTHAATTRQIHAKARDRQAAWLETGRPFTTYRLGRELGELYDEHRDEQAGTLTTPYRGRTWRPR